MLKSVCINSGWRRFVVIRMIVSGIIVLLFTCCKKVNDVTSIDLTENHLISFFDIFEEASIVPLEQKEGSLIATISQVVFYEEKYYILDRSQQKVFCFDKEGRFLSTISQQGHGPGEYIYASSLTVDTYKNNLIILSPPNQQLLVFDLEGRFLKELSVSTEGVMGLNKVFSLNDSILLITSLTDYQLIFFNRKKESVLKMDFPMPVFIPRLLPVFNAYQFGGKTFVNPVRTQTVMDVTEIQNKKHLSFDYGLLNNTERQKKMLKDFFRESPDIHSIRSHELLKSDGYLNHYLIKVMESNRFIIKLVAIENSIKHVVIDKILDEIFVFDYFKEDVVINMHFDIHQDCYLIAFESRNFRDEESNKRFFGPWYPFYSAEYVNKNFLNAADAQIVKNHNPMTDNPFLVVYKFKE